ncbi:hypothetical protein HDU92_002949 [Lobulomyces angularis]|nr:hypothetical protein HDU92_002949 [Lobulomyces angularis]
MNSLKKLLILILSFLTYLIFHSRFNNTKSEDNFEKLASSELFFFNKTSYCDADQSFPDYNKINTDEYKLVQLHVFHRHGDRSPLHALKDKTNETEIWDRCGENSEIMTLTGDYPSRSFKRVVSIPEGIPARGYWKGDCNPGQLTAIGHYQTRKVGSLLNKMYMKSELWMSNKSPTSRDVFVRSTDVWRTIQSAQSLTSGFFPPDASKNDNEILDINVRPKNIDSLSVSISHCKRLIKVLEATKKNSITYQKLEKIGDKLLENLINLTGGNEHLDLIMFYDNLQSKVCHNMKLPIDDALFNKLGQLAFYFFNFEYGKQDFIEDARAWNIILELTENLELKENNSKKIFLYSSHDTTVLSILTLLGMELKEWPPLISTISIELLKSLKGEDYIIRYFFNRKEFFVPWCNSGNTDSKYCQLRNFIKNSRYLGRNVENC